MVSTSSSIGFLHTNLASIYKHYDDLLITLSHLNFEFDGIAITEHKISDSTPNLIPRFNSTTYGLKSIYKNCINSWNMLTLQLNLLEKDKAKNNYIEIDLLIMHSKNKLKSVITDYFLSSYKFSI